MADNPVGGGGGGGGGSPPDAPKGNLAFPNGVFWDPVTNTYRMIDGNGNIVGPALTQAQVLAMNRLANMLNGVPLTLDQILGSINDDGRSRNIIRLGYGQPDQQQQPPGSPPRP